MIVIVLAEGPHRFGDIEARVEGISRKVLTDTLRALERDGMVSRHEFAELPPRVEYQLTALGETLIGPLKVLGTWAQEHIEDVLAARQAYDEKHR